MDHGDHSGHTMPGMDMPVCSMNMLWNNQVADTCVVFRSWHISGTWTMILSCLVIIGISLFYSYLLHYIKDYDRHIAAAIYSSTQQGRRDRDGSPAGTGLIPPIPAAYGGIESGAFGRIGTDVLIIIRLASTRLPLNLRLIRAGLYAVTVAISFWLMLVAMTYNTYLFSSIVVGAFFGHVIYEDEMDVG
ncbi:solute carrier family 31 (copper transporter), member 1 [Cryptococcus bacillisporus CA1873]|uniref:Copper transport protein n=1 Tax=Cryptococcus bacillisporus CA1873 TaxID=1296111 RepID=A0ABR5BBP8_CRYGA|nr:solute carrier family 31 (copper transporter), member 1 [Cryptococcus bacillisporus CA1873]|eukprot:KIR63724.1 solute carrier family 31 (copper transporter), member 1 [Cryptococcus gattii CA1873]